jgi:signal transduction histidine kinase
MLRELNVTSFMCVPLVTRGRTLGAITFIASESGRRYGAADLTLAEEIARRAALAVDNARLYREAHEANRAKSQFLATMSHELRTPLNAIAGYTELLEVGVHGPVNDAQREDLNRIHVNQRHLLGLINDVLNFAKLETGHVEFEITDIAVEEVLSGVRALIEPQIRAKGLEYEYRPGDPSVICRADRDKMQQIVLNLLSNAVKFTEPGGRVKLEWTAADGVVGIRVHDTGRGIPPEKLEAIFEPFVQLQHGFTCKSEGTGLGLAISRELARAMGGDVTATSTWGEGSTFTLTLPTA